MQLCLHVIFVYFTMFTSVDLLYIFHISAAGMLNLAPLKFLVKPNNLRFLVHMHRYHISFYVIGMLVLQVFPQNQHMIDAIN